jgi:glutathione S-transferase
MRQVVRGSMVASPENPVLKLYIGNKNYSSWSMRPWVLLKQAGIPFEEVMVRFDDMAPGSPFKQAINPISPTGNVPLLVDTDAANSTGAGPLVVWDTLAIAEYVAEKFPDRQLWPSDPAQRARARALCAEMHSGFGAVRGNFPMNIEASLPHIGQIVLRDNAAARTQLQRIDTMWQEQLRSHAQSPEDLLFGHFTVADAYYAPVCMRVQTYGLPLSDASAAYVQRVRALPGVQAWMEAALQEHDFVVIDEPYRVKP